MLNPHRRSVAISTLSLSLSVVLACGALLPTTASQPPSASPDVQPTAAAASPSPAPPPQPSARSVSVVGGSIVASGDFRGSGKSQLALLQDPTNDLTLRISVRDSNADDTFAESAWLSMGPGFFSLARSKFAVADVTFDKKDDLVALYDGGGTRSRLIVFRSTGTGFEYSDGWWQSEEYAFGRARNVLGGNFSGNGRDGLLITYQYDNAQMRIHSFESTGSSFTFGGAQGVYDSGEGQYDASRARFAVGRFTRSAGPQQLAAFYQYPNAKVRLHLFDQGAGAITLVNGAAGVYETAEGEYDLGRATISAADITGDGKDDVISLYGDVDGSARVHIFDAAKSFAPANGYTGWVSLPAASTCTGASALVVGDWNGDRKVDASALAPAEAGKLRSNALRNTGSDFTVTATPEATLCPRWPLTGQPLNAAAATRRPLYVKIDNNPTARPHYGISKADQVYEWLVEGLTTRLAAVFHSQQPDVIGSVRSARMTDAPIVPSLAGVMVYSGGGPEELMRLHYDDAVAHRYIDLGPSYGWGYRVGFRPAPYNYFTTYQRVLDALSFAPDGDQPVNVPSWSFLPTATGDPLKGGFAGSVPATTITVPYRALFGVRYDYDAGSRTYARYNNGVREVDGANNEAVAARNIVVIHTEVYFTDAFGLDPAGNPKLDMRLIGTGKGVVFRDGLRQDVTWARPDIFDVYTLKNAAGEVVQLSPGQTWIQIVPQEWTIPSQ